MSTAHIQPRAGSVAGDGFLVTLAAVKSHLRIEHAADDAYLGDYLIPAAEDYCVWYVRRAIEECALLPTVRMAALLACGDLYLNREARSQGQAYQGNDTIDNLLWAHRDLCSSALADWYDAPYCPDYPAPWRIEPLREGADVARVVVV